MHARISKVYVRTTPTESDCDCELAPQDDIWFIYKYNFWDSEAPAVHCVYFDSCVYLIRLIMVMSVSNTKLVGVGGSVSSVENDHHFAANQ